MSEQSIKPVKLAITLALVAFAIVGAIALTRANHHFARQSHDALQAIYRSTEALSQIEALTSHLTALGAAPREYAFTGEHATYEHCRATFAAFPETLRQLGAATIDNPSQQTRLASLQPLLNQQILAARQSISAREHQGAEAAQALINARQVKATQDSLRSIAGNLKDEEKRLLEERQLAATHSIQTQKTFGAILLAALGVTTLSTYLLQRRLTRSDVSANKTSADLSTDQFLQNYPRQTSTPLRIQPTSSAPAKNLQKDFEAL